MLTLMLPSVTIHAPAKLNLALSVGPRNDQGMHPICSWMVTVNLFDELQVTQLEQDRLSRYAILWHHDAKRRTEISWSITKDLAVRAHLALERHVGQPLPVQLKLEKRIPVGGGLGGGSSDAAAMLRAVNKLYDLGLSLDELATIGASIGSDVPYFLHGGSALIEGTGEKVTPHDHDSSIHAVIAFPSFHCLTNHVYRLFDEGREALLQTEKVRKLIKERRYQSEELFNDLFDAAMRAAPDLRAVSEELSGHARRRVHLTGSGSALFVICDDVASAHSLAASIEEELNLHAVSVKSCTLEPAHTHANL